VDGSAGFDEVGGFQGISSDVQAVIALSAITEFTSPDELRDDYSRTTIISRMAEFFDQHVR
jgi:hypothetical protein